MMLLATFITFKHFLFITFISSEPLFYCHCIPICAYATRQQICDYSGVFLKCDFLLDLLDVYSMWDARWVSIASIKCIKSYCLVVSKSKWNLPHVFQPPKQYSLYVALFYFFLSPSLSVYISLSPL